jgi:eukaryotic-like serine/threonine-protein kinase
VWLGCVSEDDAVVARHYELGNAGAEAAVYLERAAVQALEANALPQAVSFAERALSFAPDKPTSFVRAKILDEAWSRLDAKAAERESAIGELEGAIHDPSTEVQAAGARARFDDACGGGPDTAQNLDSVLARARTLGLPEEEASCAAALGARLAFAGELERAEAVCEQLLSLAQRHGLASAAIDAWQTLAVVRQTRGEVGSALDARREAVRTASEARLMNREATLRVNVGFALTTIGAKEEARESILKGTSLAQAIGSHGVLRHGQMNLLCWTSTFGLDASVDALLKEPRRLADKAADGGWIPHDRGTLGVIFYRGVEALRFAGDPKKARALLQTAAASYRATKMLDVVPVALGLWAEAERQMGDVNKARQLASEAADLVETGAPSLLNEAPIYLALHDACIDLGMLDEAKAAIRLGLPKLEHRMGSLINTTYVSAFLTQLSANARILSLAEGYSALPPRVKEALTRSRSN